MASQQKQKFLAKRKAEAAFEAAIQGAWKRLESQMMNDKDSNMQDFYRRFENPNDLQWDIGKYYHPWAKQEENPIAKLGLDPESVKKLAELKKLATSKEARLEFLSKYDPADYADSADWVSSIFQDLGGQKMADIAGIETDSSIKNAFSELDKEALFAGGAVPEDEARVQDYETKMRAFYDELSKPLDMKDPMVQQLANVGSKGAMNLARDRGLGAGGISELNRSKAAMDATAPYAAQRQQMSGQVLQNLLGSAVQRQQYGQSLDFQYANLEQQRQLAEQQRQDALKGAEWQAGQDNAKALGGGIGAGAGAALGALGGALLAPFTGGLSIAAGTALGAGLGTTAGAQIGGGIGGAAYGTPNFSGGGLGGNARRGWYGRGYGRGQGTGT